VIWLLTSIPLASKLFVKLKRHFLY